MGRKAVGGETSELRLEGLDHVHLLFMANSSVM